jgi:error-prone DNA polymerase
MGRELWPGHPFGPEPNFRQAVRLGLSEVRSIGAELAASIAQEREAGGPYRDLHDLVRRVGLTTSQLEALATAGAFDCFGGSRREALWAAGALAQEGPDTLEGVSVGAAAPPLPEMTDVEAAVADSWATGIGPGISPVELVRENLSRSGVLPIAEAVAQAAGRRVAAAGVVTHRQRPPTAAGVTFISLEDETGLLNVVCSAGLWQRHRQVARNSAALVVRGRIERGDGSTNFIAEHLAPLSLPVSNKSRDWQ